MNETFLQLLCDEIRLNRPVEEPARSAIARSIADTLAVAAAGASGHTARAAATACAGAGPLSWGAEGCQCLEDVVLLNAICAHALDFDDVHLESSIHPSVVLLPAILTGPEQLDDDRLIGAFQAGLTTAAAVSNLLGRGHYHRGWHGTGTIGAFAATGALCWLERLDERQTRSAFALAAAMSGGLQANFGTDAKPAQAGFAAVAGRRAVRLAKAGLQGAADVFGDGFVALYGASDGLAASGEAANPSVWRQAAEGIAIKLYPCCYAAARLVGVALQAREDLQDLLQAPELMVRLTVPAGSTAVLRYDRPTTGAEAKFSGPFCVAAALLDGPPTLAHFASSPERWPEIQELIRRVEIAEDPAQDSGGDIRFGTVSLEVTRHGELLGKWQRRSIPGTPEDPPDRTALVKKIQACLEVWRDATGRPWSGLDLIGAKSQIREWLPSY